MANLAMLKQGIDANALPKTILDAIVTTRRLGFSYIWIDALCIVQDSHEDWQHEAARMGFYYRDCALTISALDAPGADVGFIRNRRPEMTINMSADAYIRKACPPWKDAFSKSPLSRRAWALPERLMSTRVLHFSSSDMFWECLSVSTRESCTTKFTRQEGSTEWNDEDFKHAIVFKDVTPETPGNASRAPEPIMARWYAILEQYSDRSLTFVDDRLPAISAVAQQFHDVTGYRYLAGLWHEHILTGLLWYSHAVRQKPRPSKYIAPTWSWASISGQTKLLCSSLSHIVDNWLQAHLVDSRVELRSEDARFASIREAYLRLTAVCIPVWCDGSNGAPPYNDPYLRSMLNIHNDDGVLIGTGYQDSFDSDGSIRECFAIVLCERLGEPNFNGQGVVFFILAKEVKQSPVVLKEEEDSVPRPVYRRVGVGKTADPHTGEHFHYDRLFKIERQDLSII